MTISLLIRSEAPRVQHLPSSLKSLSCLDRHVYLAKLNIFISGCISHWLSLWFIEMVQCFTKYRLFHDIHSNPLGAMNSHDRSQQQHSVCTNDTPGLN